MILSGLVWVLLCLFVGAVILGVIFVIIRVISEKKSDPLYASTLEATEHASQIRVRGLDTNEHSDEDNRYEVS